MGFIREVPQWKTRKGGAGKQHRKGDGAKKGPLQVKPCPSRILQGSTEVQIVPGVGLILAQGKGARRGTLWSLATGCGLGVRRGMQTPGASDSV